MKKFLLSILLLTNTFVFSDVVKVTVPAGAGSHTELSDMPSSDNTDHDGRYYTETETDTNFLKLDQTTPQTILNDTFKLDELRSKTILGTDSDGKIIEGTHQDISGKVPYTGAVSDVDLGSKGIEADYVIASSKMTLPFDSSDTTEGNIRYLTSIDEPQYYDGSAWHYLGSPKQLIATDSSQAEGNNSLTGLANKYLIKYLLITTSSTDWTLTIYTKDDYATGALEVVTNRSGDYNVYLDLPWLDSDSTSEFHYNFTSASGSETHDIKFLGMEMK